MQHTRAHLLAVLLSCCVGAGLGAAPAPSSYVEVEGALQRARDQGGGALAGRVLADLRAYASSGDEDARLQALGRLYQDWLALPPGAGAPASEAREALGAWLRPRIALAWAMRRLEDTILGLPVTGDPSARENRDRWMQLVSGQLGQSLRSYEGAGNVVDRLQALEGVREGLRTLRASRQANPWGPGLDLEGALEQLFGRRNVEVTADVGTLTPFLSRDIVQPEILYREGQVSYITPGPRTRFGLLPYDGGIAFLNAQMAYSYTPVRGFQEQIAADPRGRQAAKMYQFAAETTNTSEASVTIVLTTCGIRIMPSNANNVNLNVGSDPQAGCQPHVTRSIASLIGYNQERITQEVYNGAIPQVRQSAERISREVAQERSQQNEAQINSRLARYLVGNNTAVYDPVALTQIALASRPEYIWATGKLEGLGPEVLLGADVPQPPALDSTPYGIAADVHLPSVLAGLARAFLHSDQASRYNTIMIVTRDVPPGTPPEQAIEIRYNADYRTFLEAVQRTRAANNPRVQAIRIFRPTGDPAFGADQKGQLVILGRGLAIEVAAPPQAARGGMAGPPANVYRIEMPSAEFDLTFHLSTDPGTQAMRVSGQITGFEPGPGSRVVALQDDETKSVPLTAFTSTIVLGVMRSRIVGQNVNVPVEWPIGGFTIASATDLDPSGWIRVVLARAAQQQQQPHQ